MTVDILCKIRSLPAGRRGVRCCNWRPTPSNLIAWAFRAPTPWSSCWAMARSAVIDSMILHRCIGDGGRTRSVLLVAGLRTTQATSLAEVGVNTIEELAVSTGSVPGILDATLA